MARPKRAEERELAKVGIRLVPYFAVVFDHPAMLHLTATGKSPEFALISARGAIRGAFPANRYDLDVTELNPEVFTKAGVHFEHE